MAILEVQFTEPMRQNFAIILAVVHAIGAIFSIFLIGIGTYVKLEIEEKINLTDGYNNDILPWMSISIGIINFLICLIGLYLCIQSRDCEKRAGQRVFQLPYICVCAFASICVFASAMLSFAHVGHLHSSFGNGLLDAMRQYKIDANIKEDLDILQMEYECCGGESYKDWFTVSWIANDFLDLDSSVVQKRMVKGEYYSDDVPYSCCNPSSLRPCIHHHVTKNDAHYLYNYEDAITLYTTGCKDALMDYFSEILYESSIVIIVLFCIQIVIILGMRYLATTIAEAVESGDPEADAPGYLAGTVEERPQDKTPLYPGSGDFSSDSSHALYETPVKRHSSTGSRRFSQHSPIRSPHRSRGSLDEYHNLQPRESHNRRYDTTEEPTE